jgi:hypothetical protein
MVNIRAANARLKPAVGEESAKISRHCRLPVSPRQTTAWHNANVCSSVRRAARCVNDLVNETMAS